MVPPGLHTDVFPINETTTLPSDTGINILIAFVKSYSVESWAINEEVKLPIRKVNPPEQSAGHVHSRMATSCIEALL